MKVTLVRHGAVEERYKGCYNGYIDISLSQEGRVQSQALGKRLADEPFDAIFCSDLLRAKETLAIMQEQLSVSVEAVYTKALREKSWGRHEGMGFEEICTTEGLVYSSFYEWIERLDGERVEAFEQRVQTFFLEKIAQSEKKSLLIVTHAGVIAIIRSLVENISLEEAFLQNINCGDHVTFCF